MKIPILIYHDVLPRQTISKLSRNRKYYCLELENFLNHLKYLSLDRFGTISLSDSAGSTIKPVVLTFDDGYANNYECFKILRKFEFKATFFIVTNFVGKDQYLTWNQLREMQDEGMNIQSHTCNHPFLTEISLNRIGDEFKHSKKILEEKLDKQIDSISIPQGFINARIVDMAKNCGYRYIFTSEPGIYDTRNSQFVKRLSIFNSTTLSEFKRLVNMNFFEIKKQELYKTLLSIPKFILGTKNYHLLRLKILNTLR